MKEQLRCSKCAHSQKFPDYRRTVTVALVRENMDQFKEMCLLVRPMLDETAAIECAGESFCLNVTNQLVVKELESYDDRNFFMTGIIDHRNGPKLPSAQVNADRQDEKPCSEDGEEEASNCRKTSCKYIFKVMHSKFTYSDDFLNATIRVLEHVREKIDPTLFDFPTNVANKHGDYKVLKEFDFPLECLALQNQQLFGKVNRKDIQGDGKWEVKVDENGELNVIVKHYVRLLTYVEGKLLKDVKLNDALFYQTGILAGTVTKALEDFSHPALVVKSDIWDLKNLLWLKSPKYLDAVKEQSKREMLEVCLELFEKKFIPFRDELPMQSIHSDINEGNIIMQEIDLKDKVIGLIDFGDLTYSFRLFEIAICMTYMSLLRPDECIKTAGIVLSGYLSRVSLTKLELDLLYYCVLGRLVQSLAIGNYQYVVLDPTNDYLLLTSKEGWKVLGLFLEYKDKIDEIMNIWTHSYLPTA